MQNMKIHQMWVCFHVQWPSVHAEHRNTPILSAFFVFDALLHVLSTKMWVHFHIWDHSIHCTQKSALLVTFSPFAFLKYYILYFYSFLLFLENIYLTFSVLELLGLPLLPFVYFAKGNEKETKVLKVKKVQKDVISCSKGNCCFPDAVVASIALKHEREGLWWPPSCQNVRGGWTIPPSHISIEGGVVVASVISKCERGMDNPFGSCFKRGRGGGGLCHVEM